MPMNSIKLFASLTFALLAASCTTPVLSAQSACADFLFDGDIATDLDSKKFDIEQDYSLSSETLGSTYVSLRNVNSGCVPHRIDAVSANEIGVAVDTPRYKDVEAGSQDGRPWIRFIYPSIGEYGPGLASSITFYDAKGEPKSSSLVSFYYSWEGAQTMSSTMTGGAILRCTQTIEFFSYTASGDLDEALIEPVRSKCDVSREALD